MQNDFISTYFKYVGDTEVPAIFHRWACLAALGAFIGRDYRFRLGHFNIKPNLYCMLMGDAGTRKSTAIKIAVNMLTAAGYRNIAADKTTKEKFLLDLSGAGDIIADEHGKKSGFEILEENLFGGDDKHIPELLIAADEFNVFVGNGNIEFLSLLGVMWDYEGVFKNKVKNTRSVEIHDPFVSVLAGNTPTGFSLAFPAEAIGQGIFSRLLLVYGESTGRKITFPEPPTIEAVQEITARIHEAKSAAKGDSTLTEKAKGALDIIYKSTRGVQDVRFESYANRRFSHLLKLCLIISAGNYRNRIEESDVVYANTILTYAEKLMPKALGEFGKAKHSDVAHRILAFVERCDAPANLKTIWKQVSTDLEDLDRLKDILNNLILADKLQLTKLGYLPNKKDLQHAPSNADSFVDFSLLTDEERKHVPS